MRKAWSIIWKVALVCGVAGIALMLVGFSRGWPSAVAFDRHGTRTISPHDVDSDEVVAPFTAIDVNVSVCDVRIVTGDHYGIAIQWPNTTQDITWTVDTSTLEVRETGPNLVMQWQFSSGTVTVTVPPNVNLTNINVMSSTGDVGADAAADRIVLQSSTGDVRLGADAATQADLISSTGSVTITADVASLRASTSTGDVAASGRFGDVNASSSTGAVAVSGSASFVNATSSTGDVRLTLDSTWDAVSYDFHTDTGRITVAGPGAPQISSGAFQLSSPGDQPSAPPFLSAVSDTGDIYVTLGAS